MDQCCGRGCAGNFRAVPISDDVVQESYIRVFKARQANAVDSPKAFLFATARNMMTYLIEGKIEMSPVITGKP